MSYTVQNIIDKAAKHIGVLASGESLSTEEYADCLEQLNILLQAWDVMRLNIFCMQLASYNLTNGQNAYTIGSGGTLNAPRPVSIRNASISDSSNSFTFPLEFVNSEGWDAISEKGASAKIPRKLYYDNQYPEATIYLWPTPNTTSILNLYTWEPFSQFANTSATFDMPPAYQRALEYALALDIAPMFGRQVSPDLARDAQDSLSALQQLNLPPLPGVAEDGAANARVMQSAPPGTMPEGTRPKS